jgi:hypothetical protein
MSEILDRHLKTLQVEPMMRTGIDNELHWLAFAFPSGDSQIVLPIDQLAAGIELSLNFGDGLAGQAAAVMG